MSQLMIFGRLGGHMLISMLGFMEMLSTVLTDKGSPTSPLPQRDVMEHGTEYLQHQRWSDLVIVKKQNKNTVWSINPLVAHTKNYTKDRIKKSCLCCANC